MNMLKILAAALFAASTTTFASAGTHWGYNGQSGPENWGDLDAKFATCSTGMNQSPVDITRTLDADLPAISFNYTSQGTEILNNGHTVQVNVAPGSTITVSGHTFELKQFHFHSPSENHIDGKSFPLEAHFVHADKEGNLAVIAVMFEAGAANTELANAWAQLPMKDGDKQTLRTNIHPANLLPSNKDYYRFNGSLTTPPCTEGVWWLVMKDSMPASKGQVEKVSQALHGPNNRPVQATHARLIAR